MSNKINENKDLIKIKEEIFKQMRFEQNIFAQNLEEKMDETQKLINDMNKKFEENKLFFESVLSQKYYFEKLDNLDKTTNKLNDSLIAHEIRISKSLEEINSLRTKYDKIVLDNLLLPGQIGPSCQFKNLSQYLKNNIYDMTRMKFDNENVKNLSKELKMKVDSSAKNISDLIDNSVTRSNQYTDSRISDCISVLEHKTKEMSEKIMDIRMKFIQRQDRLEENINLLKHDFEEKLKIEDEKINNLNVIVADINENLPDEENIQENIEKLKNKIRNIKNVLINFINNYQPPSDNNNNNNNQSKTKNRRNSMMLGSELTEFLKNGSEQAMDSPRKIGGNDSKINDINASKNKDRTRELLSPVKRVGRQSVSNFKYKSNQKSNNIKLKLINVSETSSDNNDNNINDKNALKKNKNNQIKNKLNEINEKSNNNMNNNPNFNISNINDSKKNKNKSNRNNHLDYFDKGKNKNTIQQKNNKNASKTIKKDNSNLNFFDSFSDSSDNNKEKAAETNRKSLYINNKKNNERIAIETRVMNHQEKNIFPFGNTNHNSYNNFPKLNIDPNNLTNIKFKNNYQSLSRNLTNNNNTISNNQYLNANPQQTNFYRTQQEEKKEIIKDFFSKYDKKTIQENLSLIKNRGNLDLYNYSVSPPDKRHFLDTKYDEIYDPPLSKEFLLNKKNNANKAGNLSRSKLNNVNSKLKMGNSVETNNKKVGTMDYKEQKMYLNNNNIANNNSKKFIKNKKMEFSNKFTNTFKNYFPENVKKEKMYSMNSSKKF